MKQTSMYLLVLSLLSSCMGFDTKEKVVGNYYLVAPDDEVQLSLSYCDPTDQEGCSTIIESTVFAVGRNKKFIVVKQHPRTFTNRPNKNITNFFILPIRKGFDWKTKNGLIGPLTLDQFNEKWKEMNNSSDLKFSIEKSDLK